MSENKNSIFNDGDCISEENLIAYVKGTLNPRMQHEIEKHLLDCEMCSDALDGLMLLDSPEDISEITNTINAEIDERISASQTKIRVMFPWQMAAAFALLI